MLIPIIIIIGFLSYLIDITTNKYFAPMRTDLGLNVYLLFHHILAAFIILGIFSNNITILKIHAVTVLIIFISWYLFRGHCLITFTTNKYCNLDVNIQFRSIFSNTVKWIRSLTKKKTSAPSDSAPSDSTLSTTDETKKKKSLAEYYLFPTLAIISLIRIGFLSKRKKK
jgi:hypothetical protein